VVLFLELFMFKSFHEYVNQRLSAQRPTDGPFGKQTVLKSYAQFQKFQDLDELIINVQNTLHHLMPED
jgi:hypothetical protein